MLCRVSSRRDEDKIEEGKTESNVCGEKEEDEMVVLVVSFDPGGVDGRVVDGE
jgi:hypothetical protein